MPKKSRVEECRLHMKRLKEQRQKIKKRMVKDARNYKSELISATWDLKNRQYPMSKLEYLRETIKRRLKETDNVQTSDIVNVNTELEKYGR